MELVTMGKVVVTAKIENYADLIDVERGVRQPEDVRSVIVENALVDTGATLLSLPKRLIEQLGLVKRRKKLARTAAGVFEFGIYAPVQLTVEGRDCFVEVSEVPDTCPVLIGQIPLEIMDWVVDLSGQRLIGNPEHGGEQMFEMF